ncbi:hypothetical protein H8356DRAFT_1352847 [Neocallimastix lanati (nom. inval.)]|nr:hypothetical protein H8356DRAFT_1352847 [Neocallimastix sp. JGI-2020a]
MIFVSEQWCLKMEFTSLYLRGIIRIIHLSKIFSSGIRINDKIACINIEMLDIEKYYENIKLTKSEKSHSDSSGESDYHNTVKSHLADSPINLSVNAENAVRQTSRANITEGEDHNFFQIVNSNLNLE